MINCGRKFERVAGYENVNLPERKTTGSAGYDFEAAETMVIRPNGVGLIPTGIKAYMLPQEYLQLHIRSSLAVKKHLFLANGCGIVDEDYADNIDNEGHIQIALYNPDSDIKMIEKGERIAQGVFLRYLTTFDDEPQGERTGGFGSTNV